MEFWANLSIFDPRKLPITKLQLPSYGNDELHRLLSHYGESKTDTFKGNVVSQEADIDLLKSKAEWSGFKLMIYLKREAYEKNIDMKIAAVQNPGNEGNAEVERLHKVRKQFTPQMLWESVSNDGTTSDLFPSMKFLFYMLLIFPISVACVERLFSKMKLIKTRLRNQLSQVHLDQLLRIATESSKEGFSDDEYEHFVDELKRRNPKMKIDL